MSTAEVSEGGASEQPPTSRQTAAAAAQRKKKNKPRARSAVFPARSRDVSHQSAEKLKARERGFYLDGVALSRQVNEETGRSHPAPSFGIPQYRSSQDKHCRQYFTSKALPKLVEVEKAPSMQGARLDRFAESSKARYYLHSREDMGAGYTRKFYGGHTTVPTDPSFDGYHGDEGYRRNTPDLRSKPSVFDYQDPFDAPKPINRHLRVQSAPAAMRIMRAKSASVYRADAGGRRVFSAMPRPLPPIPDTTRELATGPVT